MIREGNRRAEGMIELLGPGSASHREQRCDAHGVTDGV